MVVWVRRASQGARFFLSGLHASPPDPSRILPRQAVDLHGKTVVPKSQRGRVGAAVRFVVVVRLVVEPVDLVPEGWLGGRFVELTCGRTGWVDGRLVPGDCFAAPGGLDPAIRRLAESSINRVTSVYFMKFVGGWN
jgi:hypothetical protein